MLGQFWKTTGGFQGQVQRFQKATTQVRNLLVLTRLTDTRQPLLPDGASRPPPGVARYQRRKLLKRRSTSGTNPSHVDVETKHGRYNLELRHRLLYDCGWLLAESTIRTRYGGST